MIISITGPTVPDVVEDDKGVDGARTLFNVSRCFLKRGVLFLDAMVNQKVQSKHEPRKNWFSKRCSTDLELGNEESLPAIEEQIGEAYDF